MHARSIKLSALALAAVASLGLTGCGDTSGGGSQKTAGKVEEGVGGLVGDKSLKREGQKDQVVGGVKETVQDAKGAVKDATH